MMEVAQTTNEWSQFGLAGIVIASLMAGFAITGRWMMGVVDRLNDRQTEENREWRIAIASLEKSLDELTDEIKELRSFLDSQRVKGS